MIRARFITRHEDYRPAVWPVSHPYWCTGSGADAESGYHIVVAYAADEAEILRNWPEAERISAEHADGYRFTDRFPKPAWFESKEPSHE